MVKHLAPRVRAQRIITDTDASEEAKIGYNKLELSGKILASDLKYYVGTANITGLTITYTHNAGFTPTLVFLTQISTAFLGKLFYGAATASTIVLGTDVSGSQAKVILLA
jgi:hypothetical protein